MEGKGEKKKEREKREKGGKEGKREEQVTVKESRVDGKERLHFPLPSIILPSLTLFFSLLTRSFLSLGRRRRSPKRGMALFSS